MTEGFDMGGLLDQAQKMAEQMQASQAELAEAEFEGSYPAVMQTITEAWSLHWVARRDGGLRRDLTLALEQGCPNPCLGRDSADVAIDLAHVEPVGHVLVGEVWFSSGQSNMEWPMHAAMNGLAPFESCTLPGR